MAPIRRQFNRYRGRSWFNRIFHGVVTILVYAAVVLLLIWLFQFIKPWWQALWTEIA
ncbi:MAG: hypothetical protein O3A51_07415 [Verrucomicrobia bacterium]|nr:hypothetical protein [Verrucomicrobiota bacterium]